MPVSDKFIEIKANDKIGYQPMVDYESWRVAVLTDCDELEPDKIDWMQKHDQTDEVFVLLKGKCILFVGGDDPSKVGEITACDMEQHKLYNIKKSVWHNHTLAKDSLVLIVENRDTDDTNSPCLTLTENQRKKLVNLTNRLWANHI
jgi:hypothetical protein